MSRKFSKDDLGNRLKDLRGEMSQEQCSKELGISREAVSSYEQGRRRMNIDTLFKFCIYFNVSADYILGITD